MKIRDYFKDNVVFLLINIILFLIIFLIMFLGKVSLTFIFLIFIIWFIPLLSFMIIEGYNKKKYYKRIYKIIEKLDKKYLLPEVMEESDFLEGEIINDILKIISRDMHESVKYYKDMQEEYKEYIELWVHEIKTPIASAKLIIENNKNEITSKIYSQLDRIEYFVEQSLYYSRSEDISKDYVIKEFNLDEAVRSVVKRNYRDFINKKIKIDIRGIAYKVHSDVKWVKFVINQIVVNSIKYSNKKTNNKISIYAVDNDNDIVLVVEDNGAGIETKDIKRVFEKSFTGENGRKFGKGTGMGLYLCKKLCDKLSIGISIESKVGVFTRVSLKFPKSFENIIEHKR